MKGTVLDAGGNGKLALEDMDITRIGQAVTDWRVEDPSHVGGGARVTVSAVSSTPSRAPRPKPSAVLIWR